MSTTPYFRLRRWPTQHTLVILATLLAAILRFTNLANLPPQAWYDEIWFALRARDLLNGAPLVAHYGISDTAGNAGLVYLTALAQWAGFTGLESARVFPALAGVLSIPLAYTCLRALLRDDLLAGQRRWLAALAAVILSYLLCFVILSRVGMEPALAVPAALFVIWQIEVGVGRIFPPRQTYTSHLVANRPRRGGEVWRLAPFAAAGLAAGLAQYNGPHARLILPLAAWLIGEAYLRVGALRRREIVGGGAVFVGIALAVCVPLIAAFVQHPDWLVGRAAAVSIIGRGGLLENILRVLAAFTFRGDLNPRHNLPGWPVFGPAAGLGFYVGLAWAVFNAIRRRGARFLLVWLALMSAPTILSAEAPNFGRMVGAVAPGTALAGMGWMIGFRRARGRLAVEELRRWRRPLAMGAVWLILLAVGWNTFLLFGLWPRAEGIDEAFSAESVRLAREMAARSQREVVYVERLPERRDVAAFDFLLYGTAVRRVDLRECLPIIPDADTPVTYLILPDGDPAGGLQAASAYPSASIEIERLTLGWEGEALRISIPVGHSGPALDGSVIARFASGIDLVGVQMENSKPLQPGDVITVGLYWQAISQPPSDLTAFVHLVPAGVYDQPPLAQHDGPPCGTIYGTSQWQADEVILHLVEIILPGDLPAGEYELTIGWYDPITLERVPLIEAQHPLQDDRAIIGAIRVGEDREEP